MNSKIGFIGCGKMAQAMVEGIIMSNTVNANQILVSAKTDETLQKVKERFDIDVTKENKMVAEWADILFLAIKPDLHKQIIEEIKDFIREDTIVITMAAGITLTFVQQTFNKNIKAVRSMPNTPSLVGEGMSAISCNQFVNENDFKAVLSLFNGFGKVEKIEEYLMDSIPAISGSSPAYVYMFIEALADGGVKNGIPREQAYRLAAQAVLGAAKMVLETGIHPGQLKDQVCTPGGSTIEAVSVLEQYGFRAAVLNAMEQCTEKTKSLSQE